MFATLALIIAAAPQTLEAPPGIEAAPWTTLARGVKLRFGSSPLSVQATVPALLQLSVDPGDDFTTRRIDGRWKCLPGGALHLEPHPEVLELRVPLSENVVMLPAPLQVAPKTTRLRWALTVIGTGEQFSGAVVLLAPLQLTALEQRLLADVRSIAGPAAVMRTPAGLRLVRVAKDMCGDTSLQVLDLSANSGAPLTRVGDWELVHDGPWLYSRRTWDRELLSVRPQNVVFLGFPYSLEVDRVEGDTVTFRSGDFSGCFGASCGDPVNVRTLRFELYPDGRVLPNDGLR